MFSAMAPEHMNQIKDRRPASWSSVEHREQGLKESIQGNKTFTLITPFYKSCSPTKPFRLYVDPAVLFLQIRMLDVIDRVPDEHCAESAELLDRIRREVLDSRHSPAFRFRRARQRLHP